MIIVYKAKILLFGGYVGDRPFIQGSLKSFNTLLEPFKEDMDEYLKKTDTDGRFRIALSKVPGAVGLDSSIMIELNGDGKWKTFADFIEQNPLTELTSKLEAIVGEKSEEDIVPTDEIQTGNFSLNQLLVNVIPGIEKRYGLKQDKTELKVVKERSSEVSAFLPYLTSILAMLSSKGVDVEKVRIELNFPKEYVSWDSWDDFLRDNPIEELNKN